jgi:hypothetical protein
LKHGNETSRTIKKQQSRKPIRQIINIGYGRQKAKKKNIMECVPLKTYCIESGESIKAVTARIERGIWQEGKHYFKVNNVRERWIDKKAIEQWVRNGGSSRVA